MRSLDGSGGTGLQPEPHSGNETLDTEYLHMSGPDTGHVTSGSEHVGPGNTLNDLQNESVIFSNEDISITTKVKSVDHERNPDFSRSRDADGSFGINQFKDIKCSPYTMV